MAEQQTTADQGAGDAAAIAAAAAAEAAKGGDKTADKGSKGTGTALDVDDAADKVITSPADWPEDWRVKLAGEDKDALKRIERFKSPADLWKSYAEADKKIRSGRANTDEPMPDPEKDADGAKAWRKERGIPDEPSGYELPKTVQERLTDADKPVLSSYTEAMHKAGIPPNAVAATAGWYVDMQEQAFAKQEADDAKGREETQDALRSELGREFKPMTQVAKRFAEESGVADLLEARLPDGRKVGNVLELVKSIMDVGIQKYGDVSYAGGEAASKTQSRKEEIERIRDTQWDTYKNDEKMQKEYQGIIEAEQKRGKAR